MKSRTQAEDRPEASSSAPSEDVALVHGVTPDGGLRILRRREDRIEAGAVKPLKEGEPIHGEVVTLRPRPEAPLLCDVETLYRPAAAAAEAAGPRKGPAQVATERYRENWDAIWARKPSSAPN